MNEGVGFIIRATQTTHIVPITTVDSIDLPQPVLTDRDRKNWGMGKIRDKKDGMKTSSYVNHDTFLFFIQTRMNVSVYIEGRKMDKFFWKTRIRTKEQQIGSGQEFRALVISSFPDSFTRKRRLRGVITSGGGFGREATSDRSSSSKVTRRRHFQEDDDLWVTFG